MDTLRTRLEDRLQWDLTRLDIKRLISGILVTAALAVLLAALSFQHSDKLYLLLWSGAIGAIILTRVVALFAVRREIREEGLHGEAIRRVNRVALLSGVSDGVICASANWLFFQYGLVGQNLVLALTIGAATTYGLIYLFHPRIAVITATLAIVPALILSYSSHGVDLLALAVFAGIFCSAIAYGVFELRRILVGSLKERLDYEVTARQEAEANFIFTQHWRNTPLAAIEWDRRFRICSWNPSAEHIFGYSAEEAIGEPISLIFSEEDVEKVKRKWRTLWRSHKGFRSIHLCHNRQGEKVHCEWHDSALTRDGEAIGIASFVEDVTAQVKAEEIIKNQANFDSLTGLPNRRQMMGEIGRALGRCQRSKEYAALIFLDLDHFKDINDTQGHDVGDIVLKAFGNKVRELVRREDMVARFGGDEFVVLVENLGLTQKEATDSVQQVADKLLTAGTALCRVGDIDYDLDLSGGIVLFDGTWGNANELLKNADLAMYRVKQSGRKGICFYDDSLSIEAEYRVELVRGLRHGLENEEFDVHYQPIVTGDGSIQYAEGLIRWIRGNKVVPAGNFIDIMSNSPMMTSVGYFIIDKTCQNINWLKEQGLWRDDAALFVNVSPKQLVDGMFASRLLTILEANQVEPHNIVVEITEDSLIHSYDEAMDQLTELVDNGVRLALDDFGTGYSSLAMLKDLPVHFLKLDKEFIRTLVDNNNNRRIVHAIIKLCEVMSLKVIAEGVETDEQLSHLQAMGCDFYQGYRFHRPMPVKDLALALARPVAEPLAPDVAVAKGDKLRLVT